MMTESINKTVAYNVAKKFADERYTKRNKISVKIMK